MACNNKNCGCTTAGKTTLPGCDPFVCNDPNPCSSVVDSCCVIYTGDDIVDANITTGQSLCDIIPQLVTYMTPPVVTCSTPTNCCGSVTGFNVSSILDPTDPTKAVFSFTWDRKENCEVSWIIQYRISSTIPWTSVSVPNFLSSFSIANLLAGVYYDFRMYAECEAEPCYSATISVVSPYPPCNTPEYCGSTITDLLVTASTSTSITWSWSPNPSSSNYVVVLYDYASSTYSYITVPQSLTPSYTALGLTPGNYYSLYVFSMCPDGAYNNCPSYAVAYTTCGPCSQYTFTNAGLGPGPSIVNIVPCGCGNPGVISLIPGQTKTACGTSYIAGNTIIVQNLGICP